MTRTLLFAIAVVCTFSTTAYAQPDTHGPHAFAMWDAGQVSLDGVNIPVRAYYPTDGGGPFPVLAVVHGASRNMSYMAEMARTLASRGFVALTPSIPCNVTGCNHAANARQIRALLEWGVTQGGTSGSMLSGLVDGSRRGVIGHSWGGLAVFLAAQGHPEIDAVVVLDANDDSGMGAAAAPSITQPSAHLMAEVMGNCNATNWKDTVFPMTPAPHMRLVVHGAGHCDVEDPTDALCGFVCTAGGGISLAPVFRRYAVAFMGCVLQSDPAMAPYVGGASMGADVTAGTIQYVSTAGLDTLPCNGGVLPDPDGGIAPEDAAIVSVDAGARVDAATTAHDAGTSTGTDAGVPRTDAGTGDPAAAGGCGCRVGVGAPRGTALGLAVLILALAARPRRRRSAPRP